MTSPDSFSPRCPTCDMLVEPERAHKYLPFCSQRCRLIDLGRWLNEEHTLPCEAQEEENTESSETTAPKLPPGWHDA